MSESSNRRDFLGHFVGGALAASACKTIGQRNTTADSSLKVSDIDPYIPKRQEFNSLPDADKRAFVEAVREMHKRNLMVPPNFGGEGQTERQLTYWRAQAESHQWFCDHGTWKFLPWHRAYMHVFELHLRKYIRNSFRLPYWDWSVSTEVPLEIQNQDLLTALELRRDANNLNDDKDLFLNAKKELLAAEDFDTIGGDESSSGMIEGPYHNMVHVYLGGQMGRVPTAAQDPIFWLHHCNVDRLWSLWMDKMIETGKIRQMFPSQDVGSWLALDFKDNFWGPDGKTLSFNTKTSLFTEQLGYNYDTMKKCWDIGDIPPDEPVLEVPAPVEYVETTTAPLPEGNSTGLRLGADSSEALRLRFQLSPKMLSSPYPLRSLRLKTHGIPIPKDASWSYKVRLEIGKESFTLADIAFFPGASGKHADHGAIGINLNRYKDIIRNLVRSPMEVALVLQPFDKKDKPKTLKEALSSIPSKGSISIRVKAVFAIN